MEFTPAIYEHAAALINKTPWKVSRNSDLLFEAHCKAYETYKHTPVIIGIDIYNLEAEAYGCVINEPGRDGIPAITNHICPTILDLSKLPTFNPKTDGRISMMIEVAKKIKDKYPEADVRIPLSGPFSIASNLAGFQNLLFAVALEPENTIKGLDNLIEGQLVFCEAIKNAGLDIAFFESAAAPPLLSPDLFRDIALPALKTMIEKTSEILGHSVPCIIGGNTEPVLDYILETGTSYVIAPSETDQKAFMEKIWDKTDVRVRINMKTEVFVQDSWDLIKNEVDRILSIIKGRDNVCIGSGTLPFEANPKYVLQISEYLSSL